MLTSSRPVQAIEDFGALDARAPEQLAARPGAEKELDVERLETVAHGRRVIDDDDFVLLRQRLREGKADLAAAHDDDPHAPRF